MDKANGELGVFQEMRVMDGIHMRELAKYHVLVAKTPIQHQVGVSVLFPLLARLLVEAQQFHDPNVSTFHLDLEGQKWFVVGCYLVPDYASTVECVVAAISQFPHGAALMVAGDLNTDLDEP